MSKPEPTHVHNTNKNLKIRFSKYNDTVLVCVKNKPVEEVELNYEKNEDDFGPSKYTTFYHGNKCYLTSEFKEIK